MKKLLLLLALAASASAAHAQARAGGNMASTDYTGGKTTESRNTGFGVKGGYNYNNVRGADISGLNRDARSDFHAGLYGQFGFSSFSSLQVELLYSRQGFGLTGSGIKQDFRMDYLMVPIMYVGNVTETLSFHVGPQVALMTQALSDGKDLKIADAGLNSLDYGGVAGLEARFGPARLGARYNLSLGKIYEDGKTTGSLANADIYNNLFQVYLGIGFTQ